MQESLQFLEHTEHRYLTILNFLGEIMKRDSYQLPYFLTLFRCEDVKRILSSFFPVQQVLSNLPMMTFDLTFTVLCKYTPGFCAI